MLVLTLAHVESTTARDQFRTELFDDMKFAMDYQTAVWETDYIPAFRVFFAHHGHVHVRFRGDYEDSNQWWGAKLIPLEKLGALVDNIRTGRTAVPPQHHTELVQTMGFVFHTRSPTSTEGLAGTRHGAARLAP